MSPDRTLSWNGAFIPDVRPDFGSLGIRLENLVASDLATVARELRVYEPFHVQIWLHGFYLGHHYEGGFNGTTGEFFFSSICTNGRELFDVSSLGAGGTRKGAWEKVGKGTWIDTGALLLWPDPKLSDQDREVPTDALYFQLRLMERDDDGVANKILKGLNDAFKPLVLAQADPAVASSYQAAIELASQLIGVYANDDVALSQLVGLSGPMENYRAGRFVKLLGDRGSYAIISVVPDKDPETTYWNSSTQLGVENDTVSFPLDTKGKEEQRLVAILVRPHNPLLLTSVTLDNTGESFFTIFEAAATRHYVLPAGDENVSVTIRSPGSADVRVLATAVRSDGARPFPGL